MNIKSIGRVLAFISASVCIVSNFSGCSENNFKFPIAVLPDEVKNITYNPNLEIINITEQSNTTGNEAEIKPNDVLANKSFDVYFDNTTGCFLGYLKAQKKDKNDVGYQMFAKTMISFKDTFDCAGSYKTYSLQPDEKTILLWKEYPQNIFTNFGNNSAYTENTDSKFANNEAPVTMWLEEVKKHFDNGENSTIVYISDLNEQNGLLSQSGTAVKDILNSNPDKDLLIISYVLPYKGDISSPTFGNEGNNQSQVETKSFNENVYRNYYALAFGDHDTLSALRIKIDEGFRDISLPMNAYMYRDFFYSEKETLTRSKNGEKIESQDFINNNPPVISIADKDGNIISDGVSEKNIKTETEINDNNSLFGGGNDKKDNSSENQLLQNLEISDEYKNFFGEEPQGETYMFINSIPNQGELGSEVTLRLDNSEIYDIDTENAVIYTYIPEDGGSSFDSESTETGWVKFNGTKDSIWSAEINNDSITIKLSDVLSPDTIPSIILSVPVKIYYTNETVSSEVINISQEFREWVNNCKVPDILTAENETEKYTKTYGFDSFIDKITGYKSMPEEGDKKSGTPEIITHSDDVCRVNLILVASNEK